MDQFEIAQDELDRSLAEGEITQHEYNEQMQELQRDYRGEAEEAAEEAYRRELENW